MGSLFPIDDPKAFFISTASCWYCMSYLAGCAISIGLALYVLFQKKWTFGRSIVLRIMIAFVLSFAGIVLLYVTYKSAIINYRFSVPKEIPVEQRSK